MANKENKLLRSASVQLDIAVNLILNANTSLTTYQKTGLSESQTTARRICEETDLKALLKEKRLRNSKRHFSYKAPDEPVTDALKVNYMH